MIYTITLNPTLDYTINVPKFEIGKINRIIDEKIMPGGKGINVSIVLNNLGIDNIAYGFIADFSGKKLTQLLQKINVKTDFVVANKGITRINVKIIGEKETAINGIGPELNEKEINELVEKMNNIKKDDIVVVAGNAPKCIKKELYGIISKRIYEKNAKLIVDTSNELLIETLQYNPFLIKPNKDEIEETFNVKINDKKDIIYYAKKLQKMGAQNVLVSLSEDGAILITKKIEYYANAPKGKVINTVGAGDSMVAGFIAGYVKNEDFEEALKMGIATGSASAFSKELANLKDVEKILGKGEILTKVNK